MSEKDTNLKYVSFGVGYSVYKTTVSRKYELRQKYIPKDPKKITAFIPGTILEIKVTEGSEVSRGACLLILDAMKMKNKLLAPFNGTIKKVHVEKGNTVTKNQVLVELE
ncbi:MAG: acetyl-CoA carboxylase biotin carboxyl carrier protein subunit [Bacteroidota bacterium]